MPIDEESLPYPAANTILVSSLDIIAIRPTTRMCCVFFCKRVFKHIFFFILRANGVWMNIYSVTDQQMTESLMIHTYMAIGNSS